MDGGKFLGAFRAASGIRDALVLNHVPVGCHWGAGLLKSFSLQNDIRQACTAMHENEIVFGGESSLKKALLSAKSHHNSPIIIVLSGDVPSIIGDDCEAAVQSTGLGKEAVIINAPGFKGSMRDGYEDALLSLSPLMNEKEQIKRSVNLIGVCPDDFKADADIKEIKRLLSNAEITVNSVISNCSYEEFTRAPAAELNLVLGQGVGLAEHMKEVFGIPYLEMDYPYGLQGTMEFLEKICESLDVAYSTEALDLEPYKKIYVHLNGLYGSSVSVIGDFHARPLAQFLAGELGFDIEVLSSFEEDSFEKDVMNSNTTMLFGSSFELGIAIEMEVPLIRFVYPVFDLVSISDAPFAGTCGTKFLTENIVNSALGFSSDYLRYRKA